MGTALERSSMSASLGTMRLDRCFALHADSNGDRFVGVAEYGRFSTALGKLSTEDDSSILFDYDGFGTGVSDFGCFPCGLGKP